MAATTTNRWKLGLFVLSGTLLLLGVLVWLGTLRFQREIVTAVTYFDEPVDGLNIGSPLKFRGVVIGNVQDVRIAPDRRNIEVHTAMFIEELRRLGMTIQTDWQQQAVIMEQRNEPFLPENIRVQLESNLLTGIKHMQITVIEDKDLEKNPIPTYKGFTPPWNTIPSKPSLGKSLQELFFQAEDRAPGLADKLDRLLTQLNEKIEAVDTSAIAQRVTTVLDTIDNKMGGLDVASISEKGNAILEDASSLIAAVEDPSGTFSRLVANLEDTVQTAKDAVEDANVKETTDAFRKAAREVGDLSQELRALSGNLRKNVNGLSDEMRVTLIALRVTLEKVQSLADLLERDPGSLLRGRNYEPYPPPRSP